MKTGAATFNGNPDNLRAQLEAISWRPMGVHSRVPEGQKTNSGLEEIRGLLPLRSAVPTRTLGGKK